MFKIIPSLAFVAAVLAPVAVHAAQETQSGVSLYAIDCGRARIADFGPFSDTGEYDGVEKNVAAPCFLIRHPKGNLLWESGLGDKIAATPGGVKAKYFHATVPHTLEGSLKQLGLGYKDIGHFAFSHGHGDHLGNANMLTDATWIVNRQEIAWINSTPAPGRTNAALIDTLKRAKSIVIDGDHDVFGDGSVRILATPGHTPGHQVLMLKLARSGTILLSGDLYHTHDNRKLRRMPDFNVNRANTLASMERIETILKNTSARLVIHHSVEDFESLPRFPDHLD